MMYNSILLSLFLIAPGIQTGSQAGENRPDMRAVKVIAIHRVPFSAFVMGNMAPKFLPFRRVFVLMDADDVSEPNLESLFNTLSQKYPDPDELQVEVVTDLVQLKPIVGHYSISGEKDDQRAQRAYYKRKNQQERYSYNPNYPAAGTKDVIMR